MVTKLRDKLVQQNLGKQVRQITFFLVQNGWFGNYILCMVDYN